MHSVYKLNKLANVFEQKIKLAKLELISEAITSKEYYHEEIVPMLESFDPDEMKKADRYREQGNVRSKKYRATEKGREVLKKLHDKETETRREAIAKGDIQGNMIKLRIQLADRKKNIKDKINFYKSKDDQVMVNQLEEFLKSYEEDVKNKINHLREMINDYLGNYLDFVPNLPVPKQIPIIQKAINEALRIPSIQNTPIATTFTNLHELFNKENDKYQTPTITTSLTEDLPDELKEQIGESSPMIEEPQVIKVEGDITENTNKLKKQINNIKRRIKSSNDDEKINQLEDSLQNIINPLIMAINYYLISKSNASPRQIEIIQGKINEALSLPIIVGTDIENTLKNLQILFGQEKL